MSLADEIQAAIDYGYATSAEILGQPHSIYRYSRSGGGSPLDVGNLVGETPCVFLAKPNKANDPAGYGKPLRFPQVDPTVVMPFDYLVGSGGTYFMLPAQALQPPQAVECNAEVTLTRPRAPRTATGFGPQLPGGDDLATEAVLATKWPCSLLEGTKGERPDAALAGDTKSAWYKLLMPPLPGVRILSSDVLTDHYHRRMVVSSAEESSLGWRLSVALEVS